MDVRLTRSRGVTATTVDLPATATLDFEALYREARDDVYAYAAALLRDRGAAEDATAAAFERAYRRRSRYDARRGTPRAWLFAIARNAALDELRRRKRVAGAEIPPSPEPPAPEEAAELAARRDAVRLALGRLPARDREVIALKYHAELSNAELAAVLGVTPTNAGTLLHRAMTKLRESVDPCPARARGAPARPPPRPRARLGRPPGPPGGRRVPAWRGLVAAAAHADARQPPAARRGRER